MAVDLCGRFVAAILKNCRARRARLFLLTSHSADIMRRMMRLGNAGTSCADSRVTKRGTRMTRVRASRERCAGCSYVMRSFCLRRIAKVHFFGLLEAIVFSSWRGRFEVEKYSDTHHVDLILSSFWSKRSDWLVTPFIILHWILHNIYWQCKY